MIVHALLGENKILTCGNGTSAAQAQIFTSSLVNRFEQERPSLPAITIGTDLTTQTAAAIEQSFNEAYAKQIRALGHSGDILLIVSISGNPSNLLQAIRAAHDRDMGIIALTGNHGGDIAALLDANDIELRVPAESKARIHEVHMLTLFCLCDLIEAHLFGGEY
jgi:D-sedoheptulose 7-phosphate isomerase